MKKRLLDVSGINHNNRLSWDEMFMNLALVASKRSPDKSTQVGASIISPRGRVLALGYNSGPAGYDLNKIPWDIKEGNVTKYDYIIHAELNAILNYEGSSKDLIGSTIYLTLSPCHHCALMLVNRGIKKVVYLKEYQDFSMTKEIFDSCGVEMVKYDD